MTKKDEKLISSLAIGTESETVTNPFSGDSCVLDPTGVALYDFIKGCEMTKLYSEMQHALDLFRKKYPNEYMTLLD